MTELRKNEFIDMLEMAEVLFEDKGNFINCDIPTLGKCSYYPKANKINVHIGNKWLEEGFERVNRILSKEIQVESKKAIIYENTSLVKIKEEKSDSELRDEFAGLALNGILSDSNTMLEIDIIAKNNTKTNSTAEYVAYLCYDYADAMIKQRNK